MTHQEKIDLVSMGYRELEKDGKFVWMKPFGTSCFTYEPDTRKLTQWFYGANDELMIWSSYLCREDRFLYDLKEGEGAYHHIWSHSDRRFEFLTREQQAEFWMETL